MHDVVIRGGGVVDGTGRPMSLSDVAIDDGMVVAVGTVLEKGRREVDATDKVVCPGFVDLHTHYDAQLLWDTTASPSIEHGVTTVLGGNCGFSIAPLGPGDAEYVQAMMAVVEGIPAEALTGAGPWSWTTFGDYLPAGRDGRAGGGIARRRGPWVLFVTRRGPPGR
jgi:N-acyl-D-amino-acid deacylase